MNLASAQTESTPYSLSRANQARATEKPAQANAVIRFPVRDAMAERTAPLIKRWITRYRSRRALAALDAHQLNDIGLTVEQVQAEVSKPFWK